MRRTYPRRSRFGSHVHDWYVVAGLALVAEGLVVALMLF